MQRWTSWCLFALMAAGCGANGGSPDGDGGFEGDGTGWDGGDAGDGVAEGDQIRGEFVFIDGSRETFEADTTVETLEVEGAPEQTICTSTTGGERAALLAVHWFATAEIEVGETLEQDLAAVFVTVGFVKPSGGLRAGGGVGGTVTFDAFGTESGDIVAGTATEQREPDTTDPDDILAAVESIEFRCTLP